MESHESVPASASALTPAVAAAAPPSAAHVAAIREESRAYLQSLLNKHLLVHTTDGRMFRGEFKCTDPDCNIVLAHATEYRQPTARQRAQYAAQQAAAGQSSRVVMNMTSRYLGLIVTPGHHIVKIEVEEFTSQLKRPPRPS
ncbi:LSM domain containing protein [Sporothrix schenckii 1099-18]|uniref:Sm domain-containing protein n=2 Tax=Sporothrix schenckii TaxID=29908 RepID=U7PZ21_SPOS1|nr:LSM domain containing protein [Sporothrix schenckii 1099-18]ERS99954.1 hypothetical protein HMPREF1624_03323 [Sporothrix schenckii ATCC 58251]KJR85638.1 LSM domain containing protein [Sporothrix schenckii 1099-18]